MPIEAGKQIFESDTSSAIKYMDNNAKETKNNTCNNETENVSVQARQNTDSLNSDASITRETSLEPTISNEDDWGNYISFLK